jgi:hypothetical protein
MSGYELEQSKDMINFIINVVGQTKNIIIDSGIYSHHFDRRLNKKEDIYILEGSKNYPITLKDISNLFNIMGDQFDIIKEANLEDRTYIYAGLKYNSNKGIWQISWDS